MDILESFQSWYRGLPDKKRYLEFISAALTIPVLLTVVILNLRNLNDEEKEAPVPQASTIIIREVIVPASVEPKASVIPSPVVEPSPSPDSTPSPSPELSPSPMPEGTP